MNITRNFTKGKMNKSLDERLVPNGEYVDALNVRLGSTEDSEVGAVENSKGNSKLTSIQFNGTALSSDALCIGAYEDGANETIYWFVHDSNFSVGATGKLDLIISLNVTNNVLTYHVVSIDDGDGVDTILNFNPEYLINAVDFVDNFLLFTDNYNQPRVIDVTKNYFKPSGNLDVVTAEELLVIKKPPYEPIGVRSVENASEDTFLDDRFVCFAYRWRYAGNQYSATGLWSQPSFLPDAFNYNVDTGLNDGMVNTKNSVEVTYSSGGPLVVGIDLLWKDMQTGNIRVIEKIDKKKTGKVDNQDYTFTFDSSKIFTVLPESEILRLYDNVPRLAQAQTLMGGRLIYGNYLEQYNLIDLNGFPTKIEYTTELVSGVLGSDDITTDFTELVLPETEYGWDYGLNITDSILVLDFDTLELKAGSIVEFTLTFQHNSFIGTVTPTETNGETTIQFSYVLPQDFSSAYDLSISTDFIDKIGTASNIQTVPNCALGATLTDLFNCSLLQTLDALDKAESGIDGPLEPVRILSSAGTPNEISFQLPIMRYIETATPTNLTNEYFECVEADASFTGAGDKKSLHSDRSYELGLVYMDDYARSTTTLVSPNNSLDVPCSASSDTNKIRATIPATQIAPSWATRYKFCVKSDAEGYFNIYSQLFFKDYNSGDSYFLLDGQNAQKVEEGDLLRVKLDTKGPVSECVLTTVLEKKAQEADFMDPPPIDRTGTILKLPSGVYMKMRSSNFSADLYASPVITHLNADTDTVGFGTMTYVPIDILNPEYNPAVSNSKEYVDYDIPRGSKITIKIKSSIEGKSCAFKAKNRIYDYRTPTFTSQGDYSNFEEWWAGDNIADTLNGLSVLQDAPCSGETDPTNTYNATPVSLGASGSGTTTTGGNVVTDAAVAFKTLVSPGDIVKNTSAIPATYATVTRVDTNSIEIDDFIFTVGQTFELFYGFPRTAFFSGISLENLDTRFFYSGDPTNITRKYLAVRGMRGWGDTQKKKAVASMSIEVIRYSSLVAFETQPQDTAPDIWFESSESFEINPLNGFHYGNVDNGEAIVAGKGYPQTASVDAIIDTDFFNCYSFGNGVESYKIRDKIGGKELLLGNRVLTTNSEDFEETRRFADLSYSGVYNGESNVNKLNEFNLGLLNFKPLENSYGPVYVLDGRETDILVLQEDKISYVLASKNIISDSTGGSIISSVPEVLGNQVARNEEYGISHNPESYAKWGYDKYFTDAKRGAVIKLRGSSAGNEQLEVISELGMRPWFRDLFIDSFQTQKLGAFDPYMNEYVLSSNLIELPSETSCIHCGITRTVSVDATTGAFTFCVDVGELVGDVNIDYNITNIIEGNVKITATYDSVVTTTGFVPTDAASPLVVSKGKVSVTTMEISVESDAGIVIMDLTINCPVTQQLQIIQVCYSLNDDSAQFIHNEYRWTDGAYVSPLHSTQVELATGLTSPLISQYNVIPGAQGGGFIPADGATVTVITNRIAPGDDYVFDKTIDELRYLRSNTLYSNNSTDMLALLAASTNLALTEITTDKFSGAFTMPTSSDTYLYLLYNYRRPTTITMCYDATSSSAACCEC